MGVRRRKDNGQFYIDFTVDGRRVREVVGPSRRQAVDALAQRRAEIIAGRFRLPTEPRLTYDVAVERYMAWAKQHKRSWRDDLEIFKRMAPHFGGTPITRINPFEIEKMKANLIAAGLSKSRVNRYLAALSGLYHRLIDWGMHIGENPVRKVRRFREAPGRIRYLTREELDRLLPACNPELWQAVTLAIHTGMRAAELFDLLWRDVDLENRIVHVVDSKNGDRRDIPLSDTAYGALVGRRRTGENVMAQADGKVHRQHMRAVFVRACRKAGLEGLRWHDLRHTFASHLVMRGASVFAVQELLGHKSLAMTRRYSHLSPGVLRQAVAAMDNAMGGVPGTLVPLNDQAVGT